MFFPAFYAVGSAESGSVIENGEFIKCSAEAGDLFRIPDGITGISENAFDGCTGLKKIDIPGSIKSIGYHAFSNCTGLTEITVPGSVDTFGYEIFSKCTELTDVIISDGITSVDNGMFQGCSKLETITIPGSATNIGLNSFSGCESLSYFDVSEDNPSYSNDSNGILYNKGKTVLIRFPAGKTDTSFDIPESVKTIGKDAFENCQKLTTVNIPNSVNAIGESAFIYCTSLESIIVPDSVTCLGESAFYGCINLKSAEIGKGECVITAAVEGTDISDECKIEVKYNFFDILLYYILQIFSFIKNIFKSIFAF